MPKIDILPMQQEHVAQLAACLRAADEVEVTSYGQTPLEALQESFDQSVYKTVAFVDGKIAAAWGLGAIDGVGRPWLLTSDASELVSSLKFASIYRREVRKMREMFNTLENWCDASYTKSLRLLKLIGFTLDPPAPFGTFNAPFVKFSWKD